MFERITSNWHDLVTFIGVTAMFGMVKIWMSQSHMPLRYKVLSLFVSVLVGTLAGGIALENGAPDFISLSVASISSLLARDFVHAVLDKQLVQELAKRAAENVVDKVTK